MDYLVLKPARWGRRSFFGFWNFGFWIFDCVLPWPIVRRSRAYSLLLRSIQIGAGISRTARHPAHMITHPEGAMRPMKGLNSIQGVQQAIFSIFIVCVALYLCISMCNGPFSPPSDSAVIIQHRTSYSTYQNSQRSRSKHPSPQPLPRPPLTLHVHTVPRASGSRGRGGGSSSSYAGGNSGGGYGFRSTRARIIVGVSIILGVLARLLVSFFISRRCRLRRMKETRGERDGDWGEMVGRRAKFGCWVLWTLGMLWWTRDG